MHGAGWIVYGYVVKTMVYEVALWVAERMHL